MRASALLMLALGAAAARAADPPAAAGDALAGARGDLASIRSPAPPSEAGAGLSGMGARPDDAGASGADAAAGARTGAAGSPVTRETTANWLVDAMERKPEPSRAQGGADRLARVDLELLAGAEMPGGRGEGAIRPSPDDGGSASRAPADSVYNPLDAFMSGWISARDRELLLPARDGDLLTGSRGGARAQVLPGFDLGPPGAAGDARGPSNPYIGDLNLESLSPARPLSAPLLAPLAPLELPELSRGLSAPGARPDAPRSLVPDFAQPADDFKQLKRF